MREFKILGVVAFLTLLMYYLVEPYAHHEMHKKVDAQGNEIKIESHGFVYDGSTEVAATARAVSDLKFKIGTEEDTKIKASLETQLLAAQKIQAKKVTFFFMLIVFSSFFGYFSTNHAKTHCF